MEDHEFDELADEIISIVNDAVNTIRCGNSYPRKLEYEPQMYMKIELPRKILDTIKPRFKDYDLCPLDPYEEMELLWPLQRKLKGKIEGAKKVTLYINISKYEKRDLLTMEVVFE